LNSGSSSYKTQYRSNYIRLAISQGIFLKFDNFQNRFVSSEIHKGLELLVYEIEQLESSTKLINESFSKYRIELFEIGKNKTEYSSIDNLKLLMPLNIHDRIENIMILSKFLLNNVINGSGKINELKLFPKSPFKKDNELLENEEISDNDLIKILSNENW